MGDLTFLAPKFAKFRGFTLFGKLTIGLLRTDRCWMVHVAWSYQKWRWLDRGTHIECVYEDGAIGATTASAPPGKSGEQR